MDKNSRGAGEQGSKGAGEQGSRGAGEQGSKGAGEQGSKGAGEQGSRGAEEQGSRGETLPRPLAPPLLCSIGGRTRLVGIMGWPVEHSRSPAMHNAAFAVLGLDWIYVPLPVAPDHVREAVQGLRALGFVGASVTIPHKQAVMPWLDEVSAAARAIGAVNTLVVRDGRLLGENTDWLGFLASLHEAGVEPEGMRALVLGAGGAARAVVYALASVGAEVVVVVNRTLARAEALARELMELGVPLKIAPTVEAAVNSFSNLGLVVNTTSVGMWPRIDESPWPEAVPLPPRAIFCDLVYNPLETRLLKRVRAAGCQGVDGLGMLVHQGAAAFEIWTGVKAPVEVMRRALMRDA